MVQLCDSLARCSGGQISRPDGSIVAGPQPPRWTANNKPHRKDRAWVQAWSPEQISNRLKVDFPMMSR